MIYNKDISSLVDEAKLLLNHPQREKRDEGVLDLHQLIVHSSLQRVVLQEVNNHVHTTYSFSPYEPAAAAFAAWESQLGIVGSIDHDSIGAAHEMLSSSEALGIASTVGFEVRCSFLDTPFAHKMINNPDSKGIAYMCVHGVPKKAIEEAAAFLEPIRIVRNARNRAQVNNLNTLLENTGIDLIDFDNDVLPISKFAQGGSVTERHILSALAYNIEQAVPKGEALVSFLERSLAIPLEGKQRQLLLDEHNTHYHYDLLGILKSAFLPKFFIQPEIEETPDVRQVVSFGRSIGAIPAYAYLGDVSDSVTGDKKAQEFEDAYLDDLVPFLASVGFPAITYMPPRNTDKQMLRLQQLCNASGLMEISGVDINSSRQSFNCPEMLKSNCIHLVDSAWALVAHEKLVDYEETWGLFHAENPLAKKTLAQRIAYYASLGREMDPFHVTSLLDRAKTLYT